MENCKPITSPMDPNTKLTVTDPCEPVDASQYRKLVGSLIWLLNTRLDLSFSVGLLSSFMQTPLKTHWDAGLRILRYLQSTKDLGLFYTGGNGVKLQGWSDSDWGGDPDTRRSTSGYTFTLGSGVVSWSSKKQPTIALSSTEAEYRAACGAACEVVWLRRLLGEIGFPQREPTVI